MNILQIGKAKSGSYWLFKIIQEAIDARGIEKVSYIKNHPIYEKAKTWELSHSDQAGLDVISIRPEGLFLRIADQYQEEITDIGAYLTQCSHVWTHSFFCMQREYVYRKFGKIVYIIRDPRDIAISMARFAFTPYVLQRTKHKEKDPASYLDHRLYGAVLSWVRHVGEHLIKRDEHKIHFIFYERMLHDFESEAGELLQYLELDLSENEIRQLKDKVSFSRMKDNNPEHVRRGKTYQWVSQLSDKQLRQVLRIAGPVLRILNYPTSPSDAKLLLPALPCQIDIEDIEQELAKSRGTTLDKGSYALSLLRSRRPIKEILTKGIRFVMGYPVQ